MARFKGSFDFEDLKEEIARVIRELERNSLSGARRREEESDAYRRCNSANGIEGNRKTAGRKQKERQEENKRGPQQPRPSFDRLN
ncbi:hypothetical protein VSR68_15125 [Paraburkholderia phymatum]|uniref:hypothetical protein n=1 Tax=Paraburkholderia phymatum TaxID=148447 RepID=UPI003180F59A